MDGGQQWLAVKMEMEMWMYLSVCEVKPVLLINW